MPVTNDTAFTVEDVYNEVATNMFDVGLKWFSSMDILNSIQDQYNKLCAVLAPIEKSVLISQKASPYYNMAEEIADYMYLCGIYNSNNNMWLRNFPFHQMRASGEVFRRTGSPRYLDVVDMRRVLLWPFLSSISTEQLLVVYKAFPPTIAMDTSPVLPHSVGGRLLEYMTTGDLLEQAREFTKAQMWFDKALKSPISQRSLIDQAKREIDDIAAVDRYMVLEPYQWINHGNA